MPYYYIILITFGSLLLIYIILGLIMTLLFVKKGKFTEDETIEFEIEQNKIDIEILDIPCEEFFINSRYGYKLQARWYKPEYESNKFVIAIHGRGVSYVTQLKYMKIFLDRGYNVLLPNNRYSGESGGNFYSYGVFEKYDIISLINEIKKKKGNAEILLFGESMGAATAIWTTAVDDRIKALISYCSYASIDELLKNHIGNDYPKVTKFLLPAFKFCSFFFFGMRIKSINIAKQMEKIKVPTLIMHSYGDKLIDVRNAQMLIEANQKAEVVFFQNSNHAESYGMYKEKFTNSINHFLEKIKF